MADDVFPVSYFPIPTQRQFEKNSRLIRGKAYERYFSDALNLRREVLPALQRPMRPHDALVPDDVNALLAPGYHAVENGFCELPDGSAYVASRVPFPRATGEMYAWWFWWHSVEPARYTLWYPYNHIRARPLNREVLTTRGLRHEERYVGNTHHVDEYIGSELVRIAIRFVDPAELGFDTSRFAEAGIVGHACARVSLRDVPLEVVTMVHLARATADGIEQRSRYWIGHDAKLRLFGTKLSVDKLGAALGTKRRMAGVRVAYEQLLHDQIEFTHLATFLPDIWSEFGRSAP
jgi:2,4-diacetylphloroglucinol hydrolase